MNAIQCPVCSHEMAAPTFDAVFHGVKFTPAERDIMKILWNRAGTTVSTDRIVEWLYQLSNDGAPHYAVKSIHVRIHSIRPKLPDHIRIWNRHGEGYVLELVQ